MLTLYPAIDLKDGKCVRLKRGDLSDPTVFPLDPAAQAAEFAAHGATWLHVVDLNGAIAGHSVNGPAVAAILAAANIPIQLGGGIRDMNAIAHWLEAGIRRVILGSAAATNPFLVREACRAHPGRIAVALDARDGIAATNGWTESSGIKALDLALRYEDAGVAALIYTDVARDGMMGGLNLDATLDLAFHLTTPVIASGGIGGVRDLRALRDAADKNPGAIEGVVVGRALYNGSLDLTEALALLAA